MSRQPRLGAKQRHTATGRAVRAIAAALFDSGTAVPAEQLDYIENELLALIAAAGPRARRLFVLCLFAVVGLAPLFHRQLRLLWSLPLPQRIAALTKMEASPLGSPLVLAVKAPLCVVYYELPAAALAIGWRPGCMTSGAEPSPTEDRCAP